MKRNAAEVSLLISMDLEDLGESGVFIINFEHISHLLLVFLLLTLNWQMFAEAVSAYQQLLKPTLKEQHKSSLSHHFSQLVMCHTDQIRVLCNINPSMHNFPKWSDTLQKTCSNCCKIFKACVTILRRYALTLIRLGFLTF